MANSEHVKLLKLGSAAVNNWREANPNTYMDLMGAKLQRLILPYTNLSGANLVGADLSESFLFHTCFDCTTLISAVLTGANIGACTFQNANLDGASFDLTEAGLSDFSFAVLEGTTFRGAHLVGTRFQSNQSAGANFEGALFRETVLADIDLSVVYGLEKANHSGPSAIDLQTLFKCGNNVSRAFLTGCGVPDSVIDYLPSFVGSIQPIQYYSCFISYSSKDDEFTRRLHGRLQQERLRVWFAPEDMKGGRKMYDQIDEAIRIHDKLLLVLSEASMASEWVKTEIRRARQREAKDGRQVLFPIRLVDMDAIKTWSAFDAETGKDMGVEIREYHIPDFSNWKDHDSFEKAFARLLADLKKSAEPR